jgi:hypothetical protein
MQRHYVGSTGWRGRTGSRYVVIATGAMLRKLGIFKESSTSSQVIGF